METSTIVALLALLVSIVNSLMTGRKDTRTDAASLAEIKAGMNTANSGISDIRVDLRQLREDVKDHGERISNLEARIKTLEKE